MLEKGLAALGLLACAVIALRMVLGPSRTQRFDAAAKRKARHVVATLKALPQWRQRRSKARLDAAAAIERARRRQGPVSRDGNVVRPTFGDKRAPRDRSKDH